MKKLLPILILSAFILPFVVLGQGIDQPPPVPTVTINIWSAMEGIINWLFAIALLAAIIFLIIGAIIFITGGGDPKKHETARNMIIYALIGVAVAVLAKGLVALIRNFVSGVAS